METRLFVISDDSSVVQSQTHTYTCVVPGAGRLLLPSKVTVVNAYTNTQKGTDL